MNLNETINVNNYTSNRTSYPKRILWTLIDESHPCYNRWKSNVGYIEAFSKNENPNFSKPYDMSYKTKSIEEEEYEETARLDA